VSTAGNRTRLVARLVGWVERSKTHQCVRGPGAVCDGFARALPILRATRESSRQMGEPQNPPPYKNALRGS
jgi:hypothetical protein